MLILMILLSTEVLLIAGRQPSLVNPCLQKESPVAKLPFCNAALPIDERIADLISRMNITEKIGSLGNKSPAIPALGINAYNWWSEATHGVANGHLDNTTPYMTNFALPITTAMSFNRSLWRATGAQIGREARAFMNAGNGYSTFWAPVINLAREPRWGRNIETPGEDPYLTGEYAVAFVQGFEHAPEDPTHLQASACCKHFVANSMEDSTEVGINHNRFEFDAAVSAQDLVDSYMPPFQACVEQGKASGLMCSYNAVNGVPSCANTWLLHDVARKEWGFDGYITSDCGADLGVYKSHNYTATPEEAVRAILRAGTDSNCGWFMQKYAGEALAKGMVTTTDIDAALHRLFKVRMRLSHFDPKGPINDIPPSTICSSYAVGVSHEGVAQACSLLKNSPRTLPLPPGRRVAVIGPNINLSRSIAGYYGPAHPCNMEFWTMIDAVARYADVSTAVGVPSVSSNDTSLIDEAVRVAAAAEYVVLVVGTDLSTAREGKDATSIALSEAQEELIRRVASAAAKAVVVVTMTATPLDISGVLGNAAVGAVVHVGQPSVAVLAVGDVLFGKKVPAGRLVQTILPASYAGQISIFDMNMRPGPSAFPRPDCRVPIKQCPNGTNPGRTHRFYTGRPVLPFGFGLSYTNFTYTLAASPHQVSLDGVRDLLMTTAAEGRYSVSTAAALSASVLRVEYEVHVTNTGTVAADDVVLGFLTPPGAGKDGVPLQTLFAFERVHVKAGETVSVFLYPSALDFTAVSPEGHRRPLPGDYGVAFGVEATAAHGQGFVRATLTAV